MRVIISGGGTGGHIFPAVAIANLIKNEYSDSEILFLGSKNSMESDLIPKENISFKSIKTGYINRNIYSLSNINTLINNIVGVLQSIAIIIKFKPDIVIGTGGFVSGPIVFAGWICNKKSIIHEQNIFPGITNKLLSRFVDVIMISFADSKKYFKNSDKIVLTGNPVRQSVIDTDRNTARKKLDLKEKDFLIYSFGGSGGQVSLNNAIINIFDKIQENKNIKLIHVYGKRLEKDFKNKISGKYKKKGNNINTVDYMYDSHITLAAADLIISSAGAITIAEITSLGIPSILIPKSNTAENHQEKNAFTMKKNAAAIVITENQLNGDVLYNEIMNIYRDAALYEELKKNSLKLGVNNSKKIILKAIKELLDENNE